MFKRITIMILSESTTGKKVGFLIWSRICLVLTNKLVFWMFFAKEICKRQINFQCSYSKPYRLMIFICQTFNIWKIFCNEINNYLDLSIFFITIWNNLLTFGIFWKKFWLFLVVFIHKLFSVSKHMCVGQKLPEKIETE